MIVVIEEGFRWNGEAVFDAAISDDVKVMTIKVDHADKKAKQTDLDVAPGMNDSGGWRLNWWRLLFWSVHVCCESDIQRSSGKFAESGSVLWHSAADVHSIVIRSSSDGSVHVQFWRWDIDRIQAGLRSATQRLRWKHSAIRRPTYHHRHLTQLS